jgi:hypothetical protein
VPLAIEHIRTFALDDHPRTCRSQRLMRREGMQMVLRVEVLKLLGLKAIGQENSPGNCAPERAEKKG